MRGMDTDPVVSADAVYLALTLFVLAIASSAYLLYVLFLRIRRKPLGRFHKLGAAISTVLIAAFLLVALA